MKITKKLRDVTYEEIAKWYEKECDGIKPCNECIFFKLRCYPYDECCWVKNKDMYSDKFLDQTIEIEAPEILDEKEKEYLSAVIKPFRDKIRSIKKAPSSWYKDKAWIEITSLTIPKGVYHVTQLPYFDRERMYVNMEDNRPYTLEELGL